MQHRALPARRRPSRTPPFAAVVLALVLIGASVVVARTVFFGGDAASPRARPALELDRPGAEISPSPSPSPSPSAINAEFPGITTFRGNASRSYYGEGPVPERPRIRWRYPASGGLCGLSNNYGVTTTWCGTGWTGQPNVIEREDGALEVRIGAYDHKYHFLDGETGEQVRPPLTTGDLAKGSATSDPDGFPLYYAGSRDNLLRIVALDRDEPTVLWSLDGDTSVPNPVWNNDWDGAPLIVDGHMLVGGENSWFYAIRLNRGYDGNGKVTVDPEVVAAVPGFDDELMASLPRNDVSIESSVAFRDGVAYFVNSGGLVQGWDVSDVLRGGSRVERVFRFWNGDDSDASVVIDEEGFLYVARHGEHGTARTREVGDLMKLDPGKPKDPLVWSLHVTGGSAEGGGIWATPALYADVVYVTTNHGELLAVDAANGKRLWKIELPGPTWMSPVPVDDRLIVGDCDGVLHAYDISRPRKLPPEVWRLDLEGCIESTPAVWKGWIWVGTRGGPIYGIADPA